jgi:hypothetical protein
MPERVPILCVIGEKELSVFGYVDEGVYPYRAVDCLGAHVVEALFEAVVDVSRVPAGGGSGVYLYNIAFIIRAFHDVLASWSEEPGAEVPADAFPFLELLS